MTSANTFYLVEDNKPVVPNAGVNVIYFTNKCNLACTYCYEDLPGRPTQIVTQEDIRKHVDAIITREGQEHQTLIVLFGGEATLEWDNVCYCMEYAYSQKKNIHFNLTTNGIKFLSQKFIDIVKSNFFYTAGKLSIDVSFDGIGNGDRVFHNGESSTPAMLRVLSALVHNKIKFRLRYTIQKNNIHAWVDDIMKLINTFKPQRVITSVAWSTLSDDDLILLETGKHTLRTYWQSESITIPVCSLFCDMCNGCQSRKELKTYFTTEGNVNTLGNKDNAARFNDFI